jgi:hypothetical protein
MYSFESAPRCGAKTKHNNGSPCRCPAIRGKARCRIHGGAKGSGAPKHNHNALKNGLFTNGVEAFRKAVRQAIHDSNALIEELF